MAGSATGIELHFDSDTSEVEGRHRYGLDLFKMNLLGLFGLKVGSNPNPKPTVRF